MEGIRVNPVYVGLNLFAFVLAFAINRGCAPSVAETEPLDDEGLTAVQAADRIIEDTTGTAARENARPWLLLDTRRQIGTLDNSESSRYVVALFGAGALTVEAVLSPSQPHRAERLLIQRPPLGVGQLATAAVDASQGRVRAGCVIVGSRYVLVDAMCR